MKEVKIKYKDLSSKQKDAISTLKGWLFDMYKSGEQVENFDIWSYLVKVEKGGVPLSASDLSILRDLWDAYIEYLTLKK